MNALEAWLLGWMDESVWTPTCAAPVTEALKRARVRGPFQEQSRSLSAAVLTQIMALESPANPVLPKTPVSSSSLWVCKSQEGAQRCSGSVTGSSRDGLDSLAMVWRGKGCNLAVNKIRLNQQANLMLISLQRFSPFRTISWEYQL